MKNGKAKQNQESSCTCGVTSSKVLWQTCKWLLLNGHFLQEQIYTYQSVKSTDRTLTLFKHNPNVHQAPHGTIIHSVQDLKIVADKHDSSLIDIFQKNYIYFPKSFFPHFSILSFSAIQQIWRRPFSPYKFQLSTLDPKPVLIPFSQLIFLSFIRKS